jgi:hypothetical protein
MSTGSTDKKHPTYGVWEVWQGHPPPGPAPEPDDEDYYHCYGVFEGHIDDIALELEYGSRERYPLCYFRPAPEGAQVSELEGDVDPAEVELVVVRVEMPDGSELSRSPEAVGPFFEGRPVVADVLNDSMFQGVRLTHLASEFGQDRLERKIALQSVLSKLTAEDIALLEKQGLKRFSYWSGY